MANALFGRKRFEQEMNEELQAHIEMQTQAYIKGGMDPIEARRKALVEFGGMENVREEVRETRAFTWLADIMRDVRIAVRGLIREPWFSVVCIFILTLAIGANTTVFSVINATFLRGLPYPEPGRIMELWEVHGDKGPTSINYLNFKEWCERQDSFSQLAMFKGDGGKMQDGTKSALFACGLVSDGYLELLGAKPVMGRAFTTADDSPGASHVALITAATWREFFAGSPDIVGKTVMFDEKPVEIIGVLPETFRHYQSVQLFLPLGPYAESIYMTSRDNRNGNTVLGRLKPGVSEATARAQMKAIAATLESEYVENREISANLAPFQERMGREAHERVLFLFAAVGLFLLIACVNLSNMFLARGMTRSREMAIRAALGATRGQIVRQLLVESVVLSTIGGVAGLLVAWLASGFVSRLIPWGVRNMMEGDSAFDYRVSLFAIALTFATGLLFGLAPALRLSHTRPSAAMKEEGGAPGRRGRFSGSDFLVMAQVALVAVLLVCTGLLVRSLERVLNAPNGIDADKLITFEVSGPNSSIFQTKPNDFVRFYLETLQHVEGIPGVENAAFCASMPYTWNTCQMNIYPLDRPAPEYSKAPFAYSHWTSPDIFRTMGIPLLKGRTLQSDDPVLVYPEGVQLTNLKEFEKVFDGLVVDCVVNKRMAEMLWPGEDAIGKALHIGPVGPGLGTAVVRGIVGNTRQDGVERGDVPEFYISFRSIPIPQGSFYFAVRTRGDPSAMMESITKSLSAFRPDSPVHNMHLMEERMSWFVSDRKFTVQMLGAFAIAALLLAAAGIYGVMSFLSARQTRQIAIRLTLGARRREVLMEVLRRGAIMLAAGLVVGLVASLFAQKLIRSQLFGVTGTDPLTFLAGAFILMGIGLVACFIPAFRASRVNPMETLRSN
jgi:predicted permease